MKHLQTNSSFDVKQVSSLYFNNFDAIYVLPEQHWPVPYAPLVDTLLL